LVGTKDFEQNLGSLYSKINFCKDMGIGLLSTLGSLLRNHNWELIIAEEKMGVAIEFCLTQQVLS
jgi:hypothetical protein